AFAGGRLFRLSLSKSTGRTGSGCESVTRLRSSARSSGREGGCAGKGRGSGGAGSSAGGCAETTLARNSNPIRPSSRTMNHEGTTFADTGCTRSFLRAEWVPDVRREGERNSSQLFRRSRRFTFRARCYRRARNENRREQQLPSSHIRRRAEADLEPGLLA